MRLILIAALGLAFAGAAHAQTTFDAYGRPKAALNPLPPIGSTKPMPGMPTPAPFKPYEPPAYARPNLPSSLDDPYPHMRHTPGVLPPPLPATPADPYPNLRPRRKPATF